MKIKKGFTLISKACKGFTLIELLVVMSILGVLTTLVAGGFRSAQLRGRDGQRKSDLKQMASALELYFSDYNKYPDTLPDWGSEFTDGKTVYFKVLPSDPDRNQSYFYRVVDPPANQKYQLFARLENKDDQDCIAANCLNPTIPSGVTCGASLCNFAITSTNTTPNE